MLVARGVNGAMLIGMVASTVVALAMGLVTCQGVVGAPPSLAPTFLKLDVARRAQPGLIDVVLVFFLLALFDSIGTLIGVGSRIGAREERHAAARAAGAARRRDRHGGRRRRSARPRSRRTSRARRASRPAADPDLASVVTATLFLLALFFHPLVRMIGGGDAAADGVVLYPIVAPALILVGVMMMESVRHDPWDDFTEAIPAFLTLVSMPLTVSITDGIAFGFIVVALLKLASGRARELDWLGYVFALVFLARYAL